MDKGQNIGLYVYRKKLNKNARDEMYREFFSTSFLWFFVYVSRLLQVLCLSPTRELAVQIQKVVLALGDYMNVQCHSCIGKNAFSCSLILEFASA